VVAIAAINRSAGAGFKGHLSLFTALTAGYREHLAAGCETWNPILFNRTLWSSGSPNCSTGWAALGWVIMPFCLEGLLFLYTESKSIATVKAYDCFFLQIQLELPPIKIL
jgi:hypothetical protein